MEGHRRIWCLNGWRRGDQLHGGPCRAERFADDARRDRAAGRKPSSPAKDPYDMTQPKFWAKAMGQGGGLGYYVGGFLTKDPTEQRGSNFEQAGGVVLGQLAVRWQGSQAICC